MNMFNAMILRLKYALRDARLELSELEDGFPNKSLKATFKRKYF